MGLELLWLLLPVAAASGWWAGWRMRKPHGGSASRYHPDYFKGLNYLLNEQQDKALEVFIRLVQVDSETVETHLALGNLFRRRGEVDRAIRIHQNLIARPSLEPAQRHQALFELAQDYLSAGLLDRAETLFRELLNSTPQTNAACRHLLEIYEREQEWEKGIEIAQRLKRTARNEKSNEVIAHYYCELVERALINSDEKCAKAYLRKALDVDIACSRAHILDAQIARDNGKTRQAIKAYEYIQARDPELLPEVIEPLLECLAATKPQQLDEYIKDLERRNNSYSVIRAVTDLLRTTEGDESAQGFFKTQLLRRPSLRGLRDWVQSEWARAEGETRDRIEVVLDLLTKVIESKPTYRCHNCGFTGQGLHWQCPSCHKWNSVKPIVGVEGE